MREPFRTLFSGYEEHWLLARYLRGDEPDWYGLVTLHEDGRWESLSGGEKALLDFAAWLAGPFHNLDAEHRTRVLHAVLVTCDA